MKSQHTEEARRGPHWTLSGLAVALGVCLALVAFEGLGRWIATVPANPPPIAPAPWAPEALGQDSPLPVRLEAPGEPVRVLPVVLGNDARWDSSEAIWEPFEFGDPLADGVPRDMPWLDIREVQLSTGRVSAFQIVLAGPPPSPRPAQIDAWIAYGVVFDTDGDGRADMQIGMDNTAEDTHRAWWADLRTGEVSWKVGPPYGDVGGRGEGRGGRSIVLDTWYPAEVWSDASAALLRYLLTEPEFRFYAWAAQIHEGRVVAKDFAPDVAWLEPGTQPALTFAEPIWWLETEFERENHSFGIVQTLNVDADGRLRINAACHAGTATLVIETDALIVSDMSLVETTCPPEGVETEESLLEILAADRIRYTIDGGILELRAGAHQLTFTARFQGPPR